LIVKISYVATVMQSDRDPVIIVQGGPPLSYPSVKQFASQADKIVVDHPVFILKNRSNAECYKLKKEERFCSLFS
jgi:hypothetical protein